MKILTLEVTADGRDARQLLYKELSFDLSDLDPPMQDVLKQILLAIYTLRNGDELSITCHEYSVAAKD